MIDKDSGIDQSFPEASADAWVKLLAAAGKPGGGSAGQEHDDAALQTAVRQLEYTTLDGLTTRALYTRADLQHDVPLTSARRQPLHRNPVQNAQTVQGAQNKAIAGVWDIRQKVRATTIADANRLALNELMQGASSVHFLATSTQAEPDTSETGWLKLNTLADTDALMDSIYLELITVSLEPALPDANLRSYIRDVYKSRGITGEQVRLALNNNWYTPTLQQQSESLKPSDEELQQFGTSIRESVTAGERITHLAVDMRHWHNLGCNRIEEIAIGCASGLAYLDMLRNLGLTLEQANKQIVFHIAIDHDFFANTIKLRALREIWSYLLSQADSNHPTQLLPTVHAHTSLRMLSLLDSDNNQLRNTIACAAAAIGGADCISVEAHRPDATHSAFPLIDPDNETRRIARNIQHVLMQESHLNRVQDPLGGSPFAETHTTETVAAAWKLLQEIESAGGIEKNISDGTLEKKISKSRETRQTRIAHRKLPLVGVSEFATTQVLNLPPPDTLSTSASTTLFRDAQMFEELRARTHRDLSKYSIDNIDQTTGDAVAAGSATACHLICFGKPVMYRARAGFARNLINSIGLSCSDLVVNSVAQASKNPDEWLSTQINQLNQQTALAPVCVLCADNDSYQGLAPVLTRSLKSHGVSFVVLAGNSDAIFKSDDHASGTKRDFDWDCDIYAGCNVIDLANQLHAALANSLSSD